MKIITLKPLIALLLFAFSACQNNPNLITTHKSVVIDTLKNKQIAAQVKNIKPATYTNKADIVEQIVTTSPTFLKMTEGLAALVVKNGGTSFGVSMESSPNMEISGTDDQANTYIFELHESYPDRNVTIARFSFDPKKRQLFRYNGVNDTWTAIDLDKRWLVKFDEYDN
jgi:hypothetical protein